MLHLLSQYGDTTNAMTGFRFVVQNMLYQLRLARDPEQSTSDDERWIEMNEDEFEELCGLLQACDDGDVSSRRAVGRLMEPVSAKFNKIGRMVLWARIMTPDGMDNMMHEWLVTPEHERLEWSEYMEDCVGGENFASNGAI
jgi:hypothetical protein